MQFRNNDLNSKSDQTDAIGELQESEMEVGRDEYKNNELRSERFNNKQTNDLKYMKDLIETIQEQRPRN